MIQTFYGLRQLPFGKDLPAEQLLPTAPFAECRQRLAYMRQRRGLMLLTGEPGTGKTAAVRAFVEPLPPSAHKVFYLPLATVSPLDFYLQLNDAFGGTPSHRKPTLFKNLHKAIQDWVTHAKTTPVLVLDELQYLPDKTLDELPALLNFKLDSLDPLLTILIAHPHFATRLRRPTFRNIDQRILLRYHMTPLDENETRTYIHHHLLRVGDRDDLFTDAACLALFNATGGVPRLLNNLCLTTLALGALEKKDSLSEDEVYRASQELEP